MIRKKKLRLLPALLSVMMVFAMMPMTGVMAYTDDGLPKSGSIILSGDANDLQDQTVTFKCLQDSVISPSKILKTNFTNSDDYTWWIGKNERTATTVTLSKDDTENVEFHDLTKNDAIKITYNEGSAERLLFSATGDDFGKKISIDVQGETVPPSLGDDETITLKVGERITLGDLSQIFDDDGNSYVLHEYNYQASDYDHNIISLEKCASDGTAVTGDDERYVTRLDAVGNKVGQTVVEATLCNNDRVPIEIVDSVPPHITKKYTINVVADDSNSDPVDPTNVPHGSTPETAGVSGMLAAKATAKGKTDLIIRWSKVEGAAGYDIFFAKCNSKGKAYSCRNVKTIEGNDTFVWKAKDLKKKRSYKAYVKAYVMKDGNKTYVRTSPKVHAYTGGFTKKYTNAKAVKVKRSSVSLNQGETFKVKAKVIKLKKSKRLMPGKHVARVRYMSSDESVATVSGSGRITAKGKGICTVVAFAHNGVSKKVKVYVK